MAVQNVFSRREVKYLITEKQRELMLAAMQGRMQPDEYGKSTICSIYYDTPDRLLIRRSIESPRYKEKLRLRSYGTAKPGDTVYAEIKKKYKGIVYKRRAGMELHAAEKWLAGGGHPPEPDAPFARAQIMREIDFFLARYKNLAPAMFISGEREAFYALDDREFRITFDERILWRDFDLTLDRGIYGEPLLRDGYYLMELKAGGALPMWVCRILSEQHIFKASFSKYGNAYRETAFDAATGKFKFIGAEHAAEYLLRGETEHV